MKGKEFPNDYSNIASNQDGSGSEKYKFVLYLYVPRKSDNQILHDMFANSKNKFKYFLFIFFLD